MAKVAILGSGNFGFGLMTHLDRKADPELDLWLYDRKPENVVYIDQTRNHPRFFPTVELSQRVSVTGDLQAVISGSDVVVMAIVSTAVAGLTTQIRPWLKPGVALVSVMKALDTQTGQTLTSVMKDNLGDIPVTLAVLAGGTTGEALTREEYLGATLASNDPRQMERLLGIFESPHLRIQVSRDVLGVQYAGSLKNCLSVIVGILAGLGFAYGTQTHALSLGATECEELAVSLGAKRETFTFASQCWGCDMVMSATDSRTRNHQLGLLLGQGLKFSAAAYQLCQKGQTAESINTLAVLPKIANLEKYPLLQFLTRLARDEVPAHELVKVIETHPE